MYNFEGQIQTIFIYLDGHNIQIILGMDAVSIIWVLSWF
jgi:hypothetical protein